MHDTPPAWALEIIARLDRIEAALVMPTVSDPWLTREQAEAYLNFSRTAFFRARVEHPATLKPCSEHPLRWSRNALDAFKMSRGTVGNSAHLRRGRKRKEAAREGL